MKKLLQKLTLAKSFKVEFSLGGFSPAMSPLEACWTWFKHGGTIIRNLNNN